MFENINIEDVLSVITFIVYVWESFAQDILKLFGLTHNRS